MFESIYSITVTPAQFFLMSGVTLLAGVIYAWVMSFCIRSAKRFFLVISLIPATYIVSGWNFAISIMHTALALWILMLFLIPWLLILLMRGKAAKAVFTSIGIGTVVPLPFAAAMLLYTRGPMFMLFVICATKAMDTGGYIFGMLSNRMMKNGNHKLCPTVSPKKSWEGAAGGMLLSIAVGWCFFKCVGMLPLWWYVAFSAALAAASIMGDLTESALKRGCGVKDSGSWIPGMGGALDVLDSFIYTAMVSVVFTMLIK